MDLRLRITQKEGISMSSLVKQMCALKCRIKVNTDEGDFSIEGMEDSNVEKVIDSVNEAFNIVGVEIIPAVETPESEAPVITEDSLEIAKIEFSDKEVEDQINKLMRTIYWAMYAKNATSRNICQYLMTTASEIVMRYSPHEIMKFSVGDIVVCNFGIHLNGEISGGHVHAIVCDIDDDGTFYAAPITKIRREGEPQKYLTFTAYRDVDYTVSRYTGGTVLLKKGGYIRSERVHEIVGTVHPEFFAKLLEALPDTIRFSPVEYAEKHAERYGDVDNDDSMLSNGLATIEEETLDAEVTEVTAKENSEKGAAETISEESLNGAAIEEKAVECNTSEVKEKLSAEEYIEKLLASPIANLDNSKPINEQVDMFLDGMGLQTSEEIIKQSFIAAHHLKKFKLKVCYESIILEVNNIYPMLDEETIKAIIKREFQKWLIRHPEVKEKYPKISLMVVLKVFARNTI